MPRFHFNVSDGVDKPDFVGLELPTFDAARVEAIRRSGEILAIEGRRLALGEEWRMEVTDGHGSVVFRLDFYVKEPAAIDQT